jgi:GDPmannose 4,6-dehydratase
MTQVLVTGITGQDGSYLLDRLASEEVEVTGIVRPGDPGVVEARRRVPSMKVVEADLADVSAFSRIVAEAAPDEFYHLAGISSVATSWRAPVETGAVTGLAAVAAMTAALEANPDCRIVLASSGEVYAGVHRATYDEESAFAPTTPYGAAKAYAHQMAHVLRGTGAHVAVAILFNHESPRRPDTFVTRKITAMAARIAWGLDDRILLGNLDVRRDWGWAPDYVDAMMRAVRHQEPDDFVVATGHAHSVREFAIAALAAAGISDPDALIGTDPSFERAVDAPVLVGDASKARRVLGWETTCSFEDLVGAMVSADMDLLRLAVSEN